MYTIGTFKPHANSIKINDPIKMNEQSIVHAAITKKPGGKNI